jgi:hypothetical protein
VIDISAHVIFNVCAYEVFYSLAISIWKNIPLKEITKSGAEDGGRAARIRSIIFVYPMPEAHLDM